MLPPRLVAVLALAALWWPSRLAGVFDGAPLDSGPDAIVLGLLLPVLLWLTPEVRRDRRVHVLVIALLAWKLVSWAALVQDGVCVRVLPTRAGADGTITALKNWDVRTDWRSPEPVCSAIADRPYFEDRQFPLWLLYNFAVAGHETPRGGEPRSADARLVMRGLISVDAGGVLRLWTSPTVAARLTVNGEPADAGGVALGAGSHDIVIDATVRDFNWILVPLWNGRNLFSAATVTVAPLGPVDRLLRPWARWISPVLVTVLLIALGTRLYAVSGPPVAAWMAASAAGGALTAAFIPQRRWHYCALLLIAGCALRVPANLKNLRGTFLVLAPAWLALNIVHVYYDKGFGRMDLLMAGNDWWSFQGYAYRIYMEGFWLEAGEPVFWFQPFYRWLAGALHMLFGQSPVGENYWDAIAVVIFALFSSEVVRTGYGFRWGCAAGALVITTFLSGPGYVFVGRGLSEISSAAFIYIGALLVLRAREHRKAPVLFIAGACAVLGAWTRLNNLPLAIAIALFAWPLSQPAAALWKPRTLFASVWAPAVVIVPLVIAFGMFLFTLRTWYYTGVFSLFHGTQAASLAVWKPGMTAGQAALAMLDSVMMVATTVDPPRYHNGALPILAGAGLSVAALSGVGWLGRLPLPLVAFTLATFLSALVARGSAYSGRFSIHVIGATVAVGVCAVAQLAPKFRAACPDAIDDRVSSRP